MRRSIESRRLPLLVALSACAIAVASGALAPAFAQPSLLIITDSCPPVDSLTATGRFSVIDTFDHSTGTPTLGQLLAYDTVLAFSNDVPSDPVALGDVLADYVDAGRCVVLGTYAFSENWAYAGRIMTPGYSPFQISLDGNLSAPSGNWVATDAGDAIYSGVNLGALTYGFNDNYAEGLLDPGATLLATDGAGMNMLARAAARPIAGINVFLEDQSCVTENNAELWTLVANGLTTACNAYVPPVIQEVPALSPAGLAALAALVALSAALVLRRRA